MRFFKRYHWLEAKESTDLETYAKPWNPPFNWNYLKWYFTAIYKEYPAEVCSKATISILQFVIEHWKSFYHFSV